MKQYSSERIWLFKSHLHFLSRVSIIVGLLVGTVFQSRGLLANEILEGGWTGREISETSIIPQAFLNIPLSTWIKPGDMVRIKAFPDTALFISNDYTILENGFTILPIVGSIQVTNLTIATLTEKLTRSYAKYLAYPNIQVEPIIRLSFLGGFLNPGMHKVNPMHSFSAALSAAQGPIRDDGLRLLRWERGGEILSKDLTSDVEGSKSLLALGFKSGDQICTTILTKRDRLPVISMIISTVLASTSIMITLLVLSR